MIAVIADDFTGAAEIGGIGIRHGLDVIIETELVYNTNTDLLVIATDTRSMNQADAASCVKTITKELLKHKPELIFKKLDSVLRGNITKELLSQMEISGKERTIIVAANPVFKRVIKNGKYYIDNVPLNETCFSSDPHFPMQSANVLNILSGNGNLEIVNSKPGETLPEKGLIVGDASDFNDLDKWVEYIDKNTLVAGASGFFDAILKKLAVKQGKENNNPPSFGGKSLFILGSIFPKDIGFTKRIKENHFYMSNMPKEIYFNENYDESRVEYWADDIIKGINNNQKVLASISHTGKNEPGIAFRIREVIGKLIKQVVERIELNELFVEGGSTTSVVLKYLGIKELIPVQELDTGVIRMKADKYPGLYLTTKPGSYFWPDNVFIQKDMQQLNIAVD